MQWGVADSGQARDDRNMELRQRPQGVIFIRNDIFRIASERAGIERNLFQEIHQ
jgi:hypothetical protein